jgi:S-adenosylmethionine decarboxylase
VQKGFHLTVDGFSGSKLLLADMETVYHFLDRAPLLIGMKKLMPPMVLKYNPTGEEPEWGVTGFIIVAESHISIHTYPERQYLALDVYSCKRFDLDSAICYAAELFGLKELTINYLDRGLAVFGRPGNIHPGKILSPETRKMLDRIAGPH